MAEPGKPEAADEDGQSLVGEPWSPQTRTLALASSCMVVATGLLLVMPITDGPLWDAPVWMPVVLLVGFVLSEPLVFHVEARNEAVSFSPSDIPLALGMLVVSPAMLLLVRLLAAAVALRHWRRPPGFKLAMNLGAFALEAAIASWVLRLGLVVVDDVGPMLWVLVLVSLLAGLLGGGLAIATAISFFESGARERLRREVTHVYMYYGPGAVLGATTAVPYLVEPWLMVAHLVPVALAWTILRNFGSLSHRFTDLTKIHAFSSRVGRSAQLDDIAGVAVREIAEHMRASSVALVVFGDGGRSVEAWLGDRRLLDAMPSDADDATWAEVLQAGALEVIDGDGPGGISRLLGWQGTRSAIIAALGDETSVLGVLVVADRQGASVVFDDDDVSRLRPLGQQLSVALRKGQLHDQVQHEALHDPLTGAPNRAYFDAWSAQYLESLPPADQAAFLMIDLDRFKEVNDSLGHAAGDKLLVEVYGRLVDAAGHEAMVSRLGGDEFAIALPDHDEETALRVVEAISDRLEEAIDLDGTTVAIGGSIGLTLTPTDGDDVSTLMRRADLAMYEAKNRHHRVCRFEPGLETTDSQRLGLLGDLREEIAEGVIDVHFQPKVDLGTGRVEGVEALARWMHPIHGPLSPEVFVSLAEQSGLVGSLTDHVLAQSLAAAREWMDAGHRVVVAVNISALSLIVEEFPSRIGEALRAAGVPGELLILEITERAMVGDSPRTRAVLSELDRLGIRLSIDDFGTGYSSLVTLRSMPVSELKIDRRFVTGLAAGGSDGIIVESTIQLAHNLGMTVVAEGVETARTEQLLREAGCDLAQGFGVCRPLPKAEFDAFLAARTAETEATAAG